MYYKSARHNSTLILGLTPNPEGLLPVADVKRLKEFGDEIKRRFSDPVMSCKGHGDTLTIKTECTNEINTIVIREDISKGQRIRKYIVESLIDGEWKQVACGSSVGNKRIQEIEPISSNRFRLVITESVKIPEIKEFSIFMINK